MTSTDITYSEIWTTSPGPYGECRRYEISAYVAPAEDDTEAPARLVVGGSIYTIGAGGALMSRDAYEDSEPEEIEAGEEMDADRLRDALHLSLSGTSLIGVDKFAPADGEVLHRVED